MTSDSESMEEVSRVRPTYGSEDSSPICGDQASRLHADTSGIIQAINSMKADMASQFETVLSAVQDNQKSSHRMFRKNNAGRGTHLSDWRFGLHTSINNQRSGKENCCTHLENRWFGKSQPMLQPEAFRFTREIRGQRCMYISRKLVTWSAGYGTTAETTGHREGPQDRLYVEILQRTRNLPREWWLLKFLDYRDKERVMRAARAKKDVPCSKITESCSSSLNKQRRQFDEVKKKLRAKGLVYGFIFRVTVNGQAHVFQSPSEVDDFLMNM